MQTDILTRRTLLSTSAAAVLSLIAAPAFALNNAEAKALIDRVVAAINKVISSGKPLNAMIRDFERVLVKYGDVAIIARSAMGADVRGMSKSQLNAYTKAFQGYIARKYGKRFNEFVGGRIEVKDTRKVKSFYEVRTVAHLSGQKPFALNFLVSDKSGQDRFFDMIIEGVSLRLSEKAEMGSMLDKRKGNYDLMIADLKKAG